jgi:hypothetical protein
MRHPELKEGEVFLCNSDVKNLIGYQSKRLGNVAYDTDGQPVTEGMLSNFMNAYNKANFALQKIGITPAHPEIMTEYHLYPVFVSKEEAISKGIEIDADDNVIFPPIPEYENMLKAIQKKAKSCQNEQTQS